MTYPDSVSVYHHLREPVTDATDTFTLSAVIISEKHQRIAARCTEEIVVYDYQAGKKVPMQPFMVEAFKSTRALQEEATTRSRERVEEVESMVRALEKGSWNKEDAKEDMGGAA